MHQARKQTALINECTKSINEMTEIIKKYFEGGGTPPGSS